jgi:hypothetical protein
MSTDKALLKRKYLPAVGKIDDVDGIPGFSGTVFLTIIAHGIAPTQPLLRNVCAARCRQRGLRAQRPFQKQRNDPAVAATDARRIEIEEPAFRLRASPSAVRPSSSHIPACR